MHVAPRVMAGTSFKLEFGIVAALAQAVTQVGHCVSVVEAARWKYTHAALQGKLR